MGLFGNLFGSNSTLSKQKELEKLINESILNTLRWEKGGEPNGGELIANAATTIRVNFPRIIELFQDLSTTYKSRNLHMKNTVLPAPYPKDLSIPMAIKAILNYAIAIEKVNPSFKGQLITQILLNKTHSLLN